MSTKKELIYTVFEKLKINSDDMDITEEFISSLIDSKRAMLIKQRLEKSPWATNPEIMQEICMELENVSVIDGMTCFGKILRTKNPLPKSIKVKGKMGPVTVRRMDRVSLLINTVPLERLPFVGYNSFISAMVYAAQDYDGRLYLVSNQKKHHLLEMIKVADVFETPDKADKYSCQSEPSDINCDPWDKDYPIEDSMKDDLINMIVKELSPTLGIPDDPDNDADGDRG